MRRQAGNRPRAGPPLAGHRVPSGSSTRRERWEQCWKRSHGSCVTVPNGSSRGGGTAVISAAIISSRKIRMAKPSGSIATIGTAPRTASGSCTVSLRSMTRSTQPGSALVTITRRREGTSDSRPVGCAALRAHIARRVALRARHRLSARRRRVRARSASGDVDDAGPRVRAAHDPPTRGCDRSARLPGAPARQRERAHPRHRSHVAHHRVQPRASRSHRQLAR